MIRTKRKDSRLTEIYFLSNSFLMYAATSFSMLNFSRACVATSTASCCISSIISKAQKTKNKEREQDGVKEEEGPR